MERIMKLVIFVTTEARQRQIERESPFEMTLEDFKSWTLEDLENYGRSWARMCKDDIVMWVEDEPKELWLVVMVGVYDHGVHYIAESEEEAVQFTKDYATLGIFVRWMWVIPRAWPLRKWVRSGKSWRSSIQ
jgi:hypothetical protein